MCLESADADRFLGDASSATQRPCQGEPGPGQIWRFDAEVGPPVEGRVFGQFVNARTMDCIDVNGGAIQPNSPVVRWLRDTKSNQFFGVVVEALTR